MENAIGDRLPRMPGFWETKIPRSLGVWCYRLAIERGYLDGWLQDLVAAPFWALLRWCDAAEAPLDRFACREAIRANRIAPRP